MCKALFRSVASCCFVELLWLYSSIQALTRQMATHML